MFKINDKTYVKLTFALSLFVIFFVYFFILINIYKYKSNRIYNLRKVSSEYRVTLLNDFFDNQYKKNSILVVGDSQPNGHFYPTEYIYSTILQKKIKTNILNIAFQDARILDNIYILNYAHKKNFHFKAIIFNVNQSHVKNSDFLHLELEVNNIINYKLGILKDMKSFLRLSLYPNPISKPNEKIKMNIYNNYFDMNENSIKSYSAKLLNLIKISKDIAEKIIIYITPHSKNAVLYNNTNDIDVLKHFSLYIKKICNEQNVQCLEPNIFEDSYYLDIVHFNSKGHQKMADILYNSLIYNE